MRKRCVIHVQVVGNSNILTIAGVSVNINNLTMANNIGGGTIYVYDAIGSTGYVNITSSTFINNTARALNYGIVSSIICMISYDDIVKGGENGVITIFDMYSIFSDSVVQQNASPQGSIYQQSAALSIYNSTFSQNKCTYSDGGVASGTIQINDGNLYVYNSTFSENDGTEGGFRFLNFDFGAKRSDMFR